MRIFCRQKKEDKNIITHKSGCKLTFLKSGIFLARQIYISVPRTTI
jgi:hypothetical protein